MGFLGYSRAWRAIVLACGLAWLGPVSGLRAETRAAAAPDFGFDRDAPSHSLHHIFPQIKPEPDARNVGIL